jgi:hypothetical protein
MTMKNAYVSNGGTIEQWMEANPNGVTLNQLVIKWLELMVPRMSFSMDPEGLAEYIRMLFYVVLYSPCKLTNDEIIQRAHDQWKDWEANREPIQVGPVMSPYWDGYQ